MLSIGSNIHAGLYAGAYSSASFDADTTLLLHMDGADGSTSFPDSALGGSAPHTIGAGGNAQVDTAAKKFGTGSCLFDGASDFLSTTSSSDHDPLTGDFTVEFWLRSTQGTRARLAGKYAGSNAGWYIDLSRVSGKITLFMGDGTNFHVYDSTASVTDDAWHHVAITRTGDTLDIYIDGTEGHVDFASSGSLTGQSISAATELQMGLAYDDTLSYAGWEDELRISKTRRYTTNFTPSGPFNP